MKTYILQNPQKKEIRSVQFKNWSAVEELVDKENRYLRDLYNSQSITREELENNIIQYVKGTKTTLVVF